MDVRDWFALGAMVLSAIALGVSLLRDSHGADEKRQKEFKAHLLRIVDNKIMIACHERVKREGEYWDFRKEVKDFMDEVKRKGVLK